MPHRKQNIKTEFQGVNYVAQVVNSANCIFNKVDGSNDFGIDAYIEFIKNESATGLCIGIQIKAGNSFQNRNDTIVTIPSDKDHFEYWHNHLLPIVGIVYIPDDNQAYWIDITSYLNENNQVLKNGSYTIRIPKTNIFSDKTFHEFYEKIKNYTEIYNKDWHFGKTIKQLTPEKDKNNRFFAVKSLFHYHRNEPECWYYLINQFRTEDDFKIQRLLILHLRYLISHGDIYWHKDNLFSQDVMDYGRNLIEKTYGLNELTKFINHIDEAGITRGSFGQNIYPLIDIITHKVDCLKEIIMNDKTSDSARTWAGIILINEFQHHDIDRAIKFTNSMITNFPNSENIEHFALIKESLINDGFVDFVG